MRQTNERTLSVPDSFSDHYAKFKATGQFLVNSLTYIYQLCEKKHTILLSVLYANLFWAVFYENQFCRGQNGDGDDEPTIPRAAMNKMIKEILPNIRVANEVRSREGGDNGLFITLVLKAI